jgi:predicted metal-dependent enzyme (double-stranded beta helix superfamily)
MFDRDRFIQECIDGFAETDPRRVTREALDRACADPAGVDAAFPDKQPGIELLYRSDTLTVAHVVWAPRMRLFAHNHNMWAHIGVYSGAEDNAFFRRSGVPSPGIEALRGVRLETGDVTSLGSEVIHAVTNPRTQFTAALHLYGGDFVAQRRSQWIEPELVEAAYDPDLAQSRFDAATPGRPS